VWVENNSTGKRAKCWEEIVKKNRYRGKSPTWIGTQRRGKQGGNKGQWGCSEKRAKTGVGGSIKELFETPGKKGVPQRGSKAKLKTDVIQEKCKRRNPTLW